jgi:hypothetical protein
MSSFAACSSRTKRRKLAAAVDEFRLLLDSAGDRSSESSVSSVNDYGEDDIIESNVNIDGSARNSHVPHTTSPCSATLESNILISAIQCDNAEITKSDVFGWTWENEQAFELELVAGCKYAEDESGSCNEEEIESAVSKEQLRDWAIRHNIKHTALYDLLHILRQQNEHLPKDA